MGASLRKLISVQHDFFDRKLRQEEDRDLQWSAARRLKCQRNDVFKVTENWDSLSADAMRFVLGIQVALTDQSRLTGALPIDPAEWKSADFGSGPVQLPKSLTVFFKKGLLADAPLVVSTTQVHATVTVTVMSRPGDSEHAHAYLTQLKADAVGPESPYRGQVFETVWENGLKLSFTSPPTEGRDQLVFADKIWEAIDRNVDRMFQRMDRMNASGLGSNRGLLLAGPPGTGKTALCRSLAGEYAGRATVLLVTAKTGHFALSQVYTLAGQLSPALVLLEDLDLLVGDREGMSQGAALIEFLTVLDGLMTSHGGVITIATTNDAAAIDAAAQRAARFDQVVDVELPDESARVRILANYLRDVDHAIQPERYGNETAGMSGADLREVVRSALLDSEQSVLTEVDIKNSVALWHEFRSDQEQRASTSTYL